MVFKGKKEVVFKEKRCGFNERQQKWSYRKGKRRGDKGKTESVSVKKRHGEWG